MTMSNSKWLQVVQQMKSTVHFLNHSKNVTIFEDEIINNKTHEHASLIVWVDWGVQFKFHFQNLT